MNQYSKRREVLAKSFKSNVALLFFSGKAPMKSADEAYNFTVDRNFYYLTGLEQEEMALFITVIDGQISEKLFLLPYDEYLAKWVGGRMDPDDAAQISEITEICELPDLDDEVSFIMNHVRRDANFKFLFDLWRYTATQAPTEGEKYAKKIMEKYPSVIVKDVFPYITQLRLVKDEYEISCFRKAIHTTNLGIQQMMKTAKPGLNEMAMEGVFDFVLRQSLCKENSFQTIAASGKRATTLHYSDNNCEMKDGELFLCDLGATCNHYCADVSRTFPVNGKFTDRERELYAVVLQANKIVAENAKVGVRIKDLQQMVIDYYKVELPKHGLKKDVSEYYYHGVSHHIGLDCHDSDGGLGAVLQAGNIISDEPGLYIKEEGIGIRIEDDLLITGTGCEVLTSEIIKEIDDIENFMKNGQ